MGGNLLAGRLSRGLGGRHALVGALSRLLEGASILALAVAGALIPAAGFFWLAYLMGGVGLSPHAALLNAEIPAERRSAGQLPGWGGSGGGGRTRLHSRRLAHRRGADRGIIGSLPDTGCPA